MMTVMNAPTVSSKVIADQLGNVVQQYADAQRAHSECETEWRHAAGRGDTKAAEKLEADLDVLLRRVKRLEAQRDVLSLDLTKAEEGEQRGKAEALAQDADKVLADLYGKLDGLGTLAQQVKAAVERIERSAGQYREARIVARQAGASPNPFGSQETDRKMKDTFDALRIGVTRASNICHQLVQDNYR